MSFLRLQPLTAADADEVVDWPGGEDEAAGKSGIDAAAAAEAVRKAAEQQAKVMAHAQPHSCDLEHPDGPGQAAGLLPLRLLQCASALQQVYARRVSPRTASLKHFYFYFKAFRVCAAAGQGRCREAAVPGAAVLEERARRRGRAG